MKTFVGIQYLRAVAAIGVIVFHAAHRTDHGFAVGALGVDIFFVISGFIMWTVASRKRHSARGFLLDRVRRIAPTYWVATAAMVLGGLIGLFPRLTLSLPHVLASLAFLPAASPTGGRMWPLLVQGWTLNVEMLFYLLFASLLGLPRTSRLVALCLLLGGLVVLGAIFGNTVPLLAFYGTPRLLEFAAGAVIGEALLRGRIPGIRAGISVAIVGMAGFLAIHLGLLSFASPAPGLSAIALVLGIAAVDRAGRMPDVKMFGFLGNASYSIYLWHTFGVGVVLRAARIAGLPPAMTVIAATAAGLALGVLLYVGLEKPLTRRLARKRPVEPESAPVAGPSRVPGL